MSMPIIYIAGKYRASCASGIVANIRHAEKYALDVWEAGGVALCPHKNTALFDGACGLPDSVWFDGDLELLRRCDAIYMIPGWELSSGAVREWQLAEKLGITVLMSDGQMRQFINERSNESAS